MQYHDIKELCTHNYIIIRLLYMVKIMMQYDV